MSLLFSLARSGRRSPSVFCRPFICYSAHHIALQHLIRGVSNGAGSDGPISGGKHAAIVVESARGSRCRWRWWHKVVSCSGVVESFSLPVLRNIQQFDHFALLLQRAHDEGATSNGRQQCTIPTSPWSPTGHYSRIFKINAVRAAGSLLVSALSPPLHADDDVRGLRDDIFAI